MNHIVKFKNVLWQNNNDNNSDNVNDDEKVFYSLNCIL